MPTITDDTPVEIGSASYLIQNLGPGNIFIGGSDVTEETGVKLSVGESLTIGVTNSSIYAVSDDESDVRVLPRGAGIFSPASTPVEEVPE